MFSEIFSRSNFFFSGYFRIPEDRTKNLVLYQNDTANEETLDAIIFPCSGISDNNWKIIHKVLPSGESFFLDSDEILDLLGGVSEGSVFLCLQGPGFEESKAQKDLVLNWVSASGGSLFASGPYSELNTPPTKARKSFFMFCPLAFNNHTGAKTYNVLINHSSDPQYADTVEITPRLHNLDGETLIGRSLSISPFGSYVIDVQEYFGNEGMKMLQKTGGYGNMTVQHVGHILASYFFQTDAKGNIICGNHTQPPAGIFGGPTLPQALKGEFKRIFPWVVYLHKKIERLKG